MIKRISLVGRKDGLSAEDFRRHWSGPHIEIVRQMKGLRGCVLNPVVEGDASQQWDGIGELWFDSVEDAKAAFAAEPIGRLLAADRPMFLGRNLVYYATEHVIVPPPEPFPGRA